MRPANRGDVPAPHVPVGVGKSEVTGGNEVVFDSGSLSFVKDWVEGADDTAVTSGVEPARSDPRSTKSTRRLGVGAKPKHPTREQPEPSALQKKLTRKRQRQELADAIVGQANTHGVAEDDGESEGESKTASFKGRTKENQTTMSVDQRCKADNGRASSEKRKESDENGQDMGDEKNSRKHKARRKKRKAKEADGEADVAGEEPQTAAEKVSTPAEQPPIIERDQSGDKTEAPDQETRKQRRGWGKKGPSKPSEAAQDSEPKSRIEGSTEGRLKRKKKRSRQKNIRKDKRPLDQRPAHLRVGDPEFSGRTLTSETRKVLGLPTDEIDANF